MHGCLFLKEDNTTFLGGSFPTASNAEIKGTTSADSAASADSTACAPALQNQADIDLAGHIDLTVTKTNTMALDKATADDSTIVVSRSKPHSLQWTYLIDIDAQVGGTFVIQVSLHSTVTFALRTPSDVYFQWFKVNLCSLFIGDGDKCHGLQMSKQQVRAAGCNRRWHIDDPRDDEQ